MEEKSHDATPPPTDPPLRRPVCTMLTHARSSGCQQHSSRLIHFFTASTRRVHRRLSFSSSASAISGRLHCIRNRDHQSMRYEYAIQVHVHACLHGHACNMVSSLHVVDQISVKMHLHNTRGNRRTFLVRAGPAMGLTGTSVGEYCG